MPTPVAVLSGGTRGFELGMFKKGPIAQGFNFPLNTNYTWWNGVDILSTQYLIYTDKYTMGSSTLANTIPVAWSTPDLNDSSLLALINTLPPRVGLPGFTDLDAALNWMDSTGDFFLLKNGIENIVTTNLELYVDAGLYTSYLGTGTNVNDISGNDRDGTITNGGTFSSSGVASFVFDGSDDYINFPHAGLNITGSFTMAAWVKVTNATTFRSIISWGQHDTYKDRTMWIEETTGKLGLYFYPTSTNQIVGTSNLVDGQWHYCVATWNGTTAKIYVDGLIENSGNLTANAYAYTSTYIGRNISNAYPFYGNIVNAQIYDVELSANQVLQNYNAQKGRFGILDIYQEGLVLNVNGSNQSSYPGSGTLWTDLSGYNNDLTLTNGPTFSNEAGGSINFDGANDFAVKTVNDSVRFLNRAPYTLSVVTKVETITANYPGWINREANVGQGRDGYNLFFTAVGLPADDMIISTERFSLGGASSANFTLKRAGFLNEWHHIVSTYDGTNLSIYYDGNLITSAGSVTSNITNSSTNLFIARRNNDYVDGLIGNLQIYNIGLTQQQVVQNYQAMRTQYGLTGITTSGLVFWVDAGNYGSYTGSGTTWNDIGGGMYDVKLLNGPTYTTSGGGALIFDATDDYGQMNPSVIPAGSQISICFWNYGISAISSSIIAASYNSSDQTLNIHLPWSNANVYWDCGFPFNRIQKFASNEEYQGWHHWVFTKNASTGVMNIYLDGSLWHTGTGLTSSIPAMDIASLGNYFTGTLPHNGYIGQCQIYRKELNSTEIIQNFTADRLRYGV